MGNIKINKTNINFNSEFIGITKSYKKSYYNFLDDCHDCDYDYFDCDCDCNYFDCDDCDCDCNYNDCDCDCDCDYDYPDDCSLEKSKNKSAYDSEYNDACSLWDYRVSNFPSGPEGDYEFEEWLDDLDDD